MSGKFRSQLCAGSEDLLGISKLQHMRNDDIRNRAGMQVMTTVDRIKARRLAVLWARVENGQQHTSFSCLYMMVDGVRGRSRKTESAMER